MINWQTGCLNEWRSDLVRFSSCCCESILSLRFLYHWLDNDNTIQQSNKMIVMMTIFMIRAKRMCIQWNELVAGWIEMKLVRICKNVNVLKAWNKHHSCIFIHINSCISFIIRHTLSLLHLNHWYGIIRASYSCHLYSKKLINK